MLKRTLPLLCIVGLGSCGEASRPPPAPALDASPAFDVSAVVRSVQLSFRAVEDGFEASGDAHHVRADADGMVELTPRGGSPLRVRTLAAGAAGRAPLARIAGDGALELDRGDVVEQLRNLEHGVEQSWRLERRPAGASDFSVRVRLAGLDFLGETEAGLHFGDPQTGLGVRYGRATWIDARGEKTPIPAARAGDEVVLTVPRALLDASELPAVLDPVLSPELGMENLTTGPGTSNLRPAVAFDGTHFLVVWEDRRRPQPHLYATRVSQAGAVLDPAGISIGTTSTPQYDPAVAFTNGQYLVAWEQKPTYGTAKVYASRVSTSGVVLDPAGIFLSGKSYGNDEQDPAVSGDGTNFLVVWEEARSSGGTVLAGRVAPNGSRLDSTPIVVSQVSSGYAEIQKEPAVAFTGAGWMVVWYDHRAGNWDIYGNRVSSAGAVLDGSGFPVANGSLGEYMPAIAFDGTNALVVWQEFPSSGRDTTLYARRVSAAGTPVDATPFVVSSAAGEQADPEVAFDGAQYLVVWSDDRATQFDLYGARVTPAGAVLDPGGLPLVTQAAYQGTPALAFGGGRLLVSWSDDRNGALTVYAGRFGAGGAAQDGAGFPVAATPNSQVDPAVAFDGSNYLVVWADNRSGGAGVYGTRVTPQGAILDPTGIEVSRAAGYGSKPQLAWNGSSYLVVWMGTTLLARRVGPSGSVLDAADLPLPFPQTLASVAAAGSTFLVVGGRSNSGTGYDVEAARVSGSGVVLDSVSGLSVSAEAGNQFEPRVSSDGTGFFVVWHDYRAGTYSKIYGARVSAAGAVLDPSGVLLSASGATDHQTDPVLAFDGANYFVAWDDSRNSAIRGTRVTPAGGVLDPASVLVASPPTVYDVLSEPRVAFDGASFVVAWEDERLNSSYQSVAHTLYALRVSPAGAVLDSPLTVATHASHDLFAAMGSDNAGNTLIAYVYPDTSAGYPVDRVRARLFSGTAPSGSCTSGAQCASGFCVDGFCCDNACGGGSTSDCVACSVAAGAAANGTCGPVANGRSCNDGDACTRVDSCSAGACVGASPVVCSALDACHLAGSCAPATGVCSDPPAPDGTLCPQGACSAGACREVPDAGLPDSGTPDAGSDAGPADGGATDGGGEPDGGGEVVTLPSVDAGGGAVAPSGCGCGSSGPGPLAWLALFATALPAARRARGSTTRGRGRARATRRCESPSPGGSPSPRPGRPGAAEESRPARRG